MSESMSPAKSSRCAGRWAVIWLSLCGPGASRSVIRHGPSASGRSPSRRDRARRAGSCGSQAHRTGPRAGRPRWRSRSRSRRSSAASSACRRSAAPGQGRPSTWSQCAWVKSRVSARARPRAPLHRGRPARRAALPGSTSTGARDPAAARCSSKTRGLPHADAATEIGQGIMQRAGPGAQLRLVRARQGRPAPERIPRRGSGCFGPAPGDALLNGNDDPPPRRSRP